MLSFLDKLHKALFVLWVVLFLACIISLPFAIAYDFHKIGLV
jgi:hypothetical protein